MVNWKYKTMDKVYKTTNTSQGNIPPSKPFIVNYSIVLEWQLLSVHYVPVTQQNLSVSKGLHVIVSDTTKVKILDYKWQFSVQNLDIIHISMDHDYSLPQCDAIQFSR